MKRLIFILTFLFIGQAVLGGDRAPPLQQTEAEDIKFTAAREQLVTQLKAQNIKDKTVLEAMNKVPRHEFVPEKYKDRAYENVSLPIGKLQTISQPYMVALMTEAIRPKPGQKVLEIGTGTGYSAAVLSELVKEVYTIEIDSPLAKTAEKRLKKLGYKTVRVKQGDGFFGWEEAAPFDGIILTCNAEKIPPKLAEQLKEGGRLVMPLGADYSLQTLVVITKTNGKLVSRPLVEVQFVPMTGEIKK